MHHVCERMSLQVLQIHSPQAKIDTSAPVARRLNDTLPVQVSGAIRGDLFREKTNRLLGKNISMILPPPIDLILLAFASFRLTHFVVFDRLGRPLRALFTDANDEPRGNGLRYKIGQGITCYWCAGIWVSALLYTGYWVLPAWMKPTIAVLAVAGLQAAVESWVRLNMSRIK